MSDRLPTHLEVGGILRRAEAEGGFGTVVHKGDENRGSLLLIISTRGRHFACLERILDLSGSYRWSRVGPGENADSAEVSAFLAKRTRFDEDLWAIELDIAAPERFTAETVGQACPRNDLTGPPPTTTRAGGFSCGVRARSATRDGISPASLAEVIA